MAVVKIRYPYFRKLDSGLRIFDSEQVVSLVSKV